MLKMRMRRPSEMMMMKMRISFQRLQKRKPQEEKTVLEEQEQGL